MQTLKNLIFLSTVVSLIKANQLYFTPCAENTGRLCPSSTNRTDFLLTLKKGGTNILSTSNYLYDFFLCEQYNYDCGYMEESNDYVTVANGVSLNINTTVLQDITTLQTTYDKIYPYIGLNGDSAKCGMKIFPLELTPVQSKQVLDGFMASFVNQITTLYNADRDATKTTAWASININIRTAILQKLKANKQMIRNSTFWTKVINNQWVGCSTQLKNYYSLYNQQIDLHASYLIDSVTQKCNKLQSINFLVDQSGSIGPPGFQLALDFLQQYVNTTNDDFTKMSINFYDTTYQPYLGYGNNQSYLLSMIPIKPYRSLFTYTGRAINASVNLINSANFPNGLPKILAVLTDGASTDSIVEASNWARSNGIVLIAVGIGSGVDVNQLLQIAETPSNYIKINSYADLPKLVQFISNYFCKQIKTIRLNETYVGNYVIVPQSPSYFRVQKSPLNEGQFYQLQISFQQDPRNKDYQVVQSQIDPFPDQYTQYKDGERYDILDAALLTSKLKSAANSIIQPQRLGSSFIPKTIYFIKPENEVNYTVKKTIESQMNVTISYVAIRGNNLGFNITLKVCTTLKCVDQRNYYKSLFQKQQQDPIAPPNIILTPEQQDLSIFIIIGITLAVLACLCVVFIFACRKLNSDDEQQKGDKRKLNMNETIPTQQNVENNLVPAQTNKKLSHANVESFSDKFDE